jgi:hypothetical protein
MAGRRDEVDRLASEDHSVEFDLAQLLGAFLAERRDDSGTGLTGRAAQEISDRSAERLPDVAQPELQSKFLPQD